MKKRRIKINYNVRKSRNKVHPVRNDNCENDYFVIRNIINTFFFILGFDREFESYKNCIFQNCARIWGHSPYVYFVLNKTQNY